MYCPGDSADPQEEPSQITPTTVGSEIKETLLQADKILSPNQTKTVLQVSVSENTTKLDHL